MAKIISSCAVTGSVHVPSMWDALAITPVLRLKGGNRVEF